MAFDTQRAVLCGQFVEAAYTMYGNAPKNVTPPASADFPAGYALTAWVQMRDFSVFGSTGLVFYGFIAHSNADPHRAILAVRGTDTDLEWWDDISSLGMTPFDVPNSGYVGLGWENIYQTLEVVPVVPGGGAQPSLKPVGRFAAQVKTHLQSHAATAGTPQTAATPQPIEITGHSLGAALATPRTRYCTRLRFRSRRFRPLPRQKWEIRPSSTPSMRSGWTHGASSTSRTLCNMCRPAFSNMSTPRNPWTRGARCSSRSRAVMRSRPI
jgi:hypothetical protein